MIAAFMHKECSSIGAKSSGQRLFCNNGQVGAIHVVLASSESYGFSCILNNAFVSLATACDWQITDHQFKAHIKTFTDILASSY